MTDTQIEQAARTTLAALVAPILYAILVVFGPLPAMPWSPLGIDHTTQVTGLYNPDATLDTSRMGDR